MRKIYLTLVALPIIIFKTSASIPDSTNITNDTSIIFLNIKENIKPFFSEIETIHNTDIDHLYSVNFLSVLRGRLNGVEIQTGTWGNNASSVFFIRGEKSISTSNQPLVIIDGIPITNQISSEEGYDLGNLTNDWNLDDIESVSVLKGGQAATLYGNQAGNGAIIIHTKKANQQGLHVDFSSSSMTSQIADFPEFQNKYGQGNNGQFAYYDGLGGGINDGTDNNWGPRLDQGLMIPQFDGPAIGYINGQLVTVRGGDIWAREQAILNGYDSTITPTPWISHPDNMKDYFHTAMTYSNNLGISWVNKFGGIRVSYTNVQADNVTPNSNLTKNTISTNIDYTFFDRLNIFGTINNTSLNQKNLTIPGGYSNLNVMAMFPWLGRQVDLNSLKDYWQAGQEDNQYFNYINAYEANPWALAYENSHNMSRNNLFSSYGAKIVILKGFSISYLGGYNNIDSKLKIRNNTLEYQNISEDFYTEKYFRHNVYLSYSLNVIDNHFVNASIGYSKNKSEIDKSYENNYIYSIYEPTKSNIENNTNAYYGSISYAYKKIVQSKFSLSKNKNKNFNDIKIPVSYALSICGDVKELIKLPVIISQINLTGGYSKTGLNINYEDIYWSNNENPPVVLEYSFTTNVGLFDNKILLQANWYKNKTENSPVQVAINGSTGYEYTYSNIGKVENNGFEFNLALVPIQTKDISWHSEISYFKNKNKVTDMDNYESIVNSGSWQVDLISQTGLPVGNLYGSQYDRQDGQIIFTNGLPTRASDYTILGDVNPDYIMYFNNYFNIYGIKVSILLNYSHGGVYYSPFFKFATMAGSSYHTVNREYGIVGEGVMWDDASNSYVSNNILVDAEDYYQSMSERADEYSIMDATSLSVDEISISYDFKLLEKFKVSCTLFGTNIYTWAKNHDYNQSNIQFSNNQFYRGINNFSLPNTRSFGLKLKLHI